MGGGLGDLREGMGLETMAHEFISFLCSSLHLPFAVVISFLLFRPGAEVQDTKLSYRQIERWNEDMCVCQ